MVLATNVAESSVTLPGVRVVIDSGLAREPRFDPNSGFSRLDVVHITQASADQRAGRAGRVAEGWAYRLWPQSQRLEPPRRAEIAQVEQAGLAVELARQNVVRAVDETAARLGNTRAVCRKYYVHPALLDAYMRGETVPEPAEATGVERRGGEKAALRREEAVVLECLQRWTSPQNGNGARS